VSIPIPCFFRFSREKVGYPFSVQTAAGANYGFAGWRVLSKTAWDALDQRSADFEAKSGG
jgi:hypothetical protein